MKPFQNILTTVHYQPEHDYYYHFNTDSVKKHHAAQKSCCSSYCNSIYDDTVLILKSLEWYIFLSL